MAKKTNKNNFQLKLVSILVILILLCSGLSYVLLENSKLQTANAASTWLQTSNRDFNNGTLNNLTVSGNGNDAFLSIDISDLHLWTKKNPINKPTARYDHKMASIYGDDKVVLFGGYGPNLNSDTWVYDLSDNDWTLKPQANPANKPSRIRFPRMASIYGDDKALLFGGFIQQGSTAIYLNDTWIYDLSNNTWTDMKPTNAPKARYNCGMASISGTDKVLLFGGSFGTWPFKINDTWIYDLSKNSWTQIYPKNAPDKTGYHTMASVYGTDNVALFGGYNSTSLTNDIWVYDLSENTWTLKTPTLKPPIRRSHAMASIYNTDEVMIYGGYYSNGSTLWDYYDTWVYDLSKNTWRQRKPIIPANKPKASNYHEMATVYGTDNVVLFGGDANPSLDETWVYKHDLYIKNGTFISAPYDTLTNSSFKTITWVAIIPSNTVLKFQLRTAADELGLNSKVYVGPDGTHATYYMTSGATIWPGHTGERWVQMMIYYNMSKITISPTLEDITINYNGLPTTIVINPINESLISDNKPTFVWTFEDLDSKNQEAFQLIIDNEHSFENVDFNTGVQVTTDQFWDFPTGTNFTELPDGAWYWKVRTMDQDGDWSEYSVARELIIDTQAPNSATILPSNDGFYNNLTKISGLAADSGNGSGVTKIEISITREKDNYYWDGSTWNPLITWLIVAGTKEWAYDSSTISWESGNKYSIQSRAVDFAANCEIPTIGNLFLVDTEQPFSNIITPVHNNWINYLNTISGTSIDNGSSEINKVEISIVCTNDHIPLDDGPKENNYWAGTKWVPAETWLPVTGSNIFSYDISKISCVTNDYYTIRSRATDNAQNIEVPGKGNTFWFDNQPPEPLNISINYDDLHTNNGHVILSLEADDVGSGVSEMSFSTNGDDWSNWKLFNTTQSFELSEGDGEKTVYLRVKDYADNIADSVYDIIILDTIPPDNLFIEINDNAKYTNSNNVKLTLRGTDLGSGISEMAFSTDGRSWTPWQPFAQTTDISFPNTNDGKKNVYFKLKDHAGNIAIPISDSITLDTEPPHSLLILINNGATETNSTLVTLKLSAVDNTSEPHQISFSSDGLNWSSWEYYVEAKTYELFPDDGKKTVYFKVMDKAGNVAEPVGATILLKTKGEGEDIHTTKDSMFSIELWLAVIIIIILFLILIGLIVKPKKRMDQELLTAGTFAVDATPLPVAIKSTEQIPAATGPTPLPSTHVVESVQTPIPPTTTQPQLVKSTQVTQEIVPQVQPSQQPSQAPQIPQLPPAQNQRRYQVQTPESAPISGSITPTVIQPTISTTTPTTASASSTSTQTSPSAASVQESPIAPHVVKTESTITTSESQVAVDQKQSKDMDEQK